MSLISRLKSRQAWRFISGANCDYSARQRGPDGIPILRDAEGIGIGANAERHLEFF